MSSRLYSTIDNKILKLLNIQSTREYYYLVDNEKKIIREETFENSSNEYHVQLVDDEDEWDNRNDLPPLSGIKYSSYQKCQNSVAIGSVYDAINEYYDNYSTVYDNQQCDYTESKYYNHNFNFEDSEFI